VGLSDDGGDGGFGGWETCRFVRDERLTDAMLLFDARISTRADSIPMLSRACGDGEDGCGWGSGCESVLIWV